MGMGKRVGGGVRSHHSCVLEQRLGPRRRSVRSGRGPVSRGVTLIKKTSFNLKARRGSVLILSAAVMSSNQCALYKTILC